MESQYGHAAQGDAPGQHEAMEPSAKRRRRDVGVKYDPSPDSPCGEQGRKVSSSDGSQVTESSDSDSREMGPIKEIAEKRSQERDSFAALGQPPGRTRPTVHQLSVPNIPETLSRLGLTAKEVFAGNGEQLPSFASEEKLAVLLQQLWMWAIQLGKIAPDALVSVPRLVLVAQWGLQRMRAGAVQGRDSAEEAEQPTEAALGSTEAPMQAATSQHPEATLGPQEEAAGTDRVASIAHTQPEQEQQQKVEAASCGRSQHPDVAAAATDALVSLRQAQKVEEAGGSVLACSSLPQSGQPATGGNLASALLSSWLTMLHSAAAPAGAPELREAQHGQEKQIGVVQRPRAVRAVPSGSCPPQSSPMPPAAPPQPRLPPVVGGPPAAPQATAAESRDMLYLLGDLTGAELAEDPAFTAALQKVLHGFEAEVAVRGIRFQYTASELRQTCSFVMRQLDAQQKHWLAQDSLELFYLLLQACGLLQHIEHKLQELQDSVARKVGRISAAAGATATMPHPVASRLAWAGSSRGLLGALTTLLPHLQQQAGAWPQQYGSGGLVNNSTADLQSYASWDAPRAMLQADQVRVAPSQAAGEGVRALHAHGSDPSTMGSRNSGGGEGSRGGAPSLPTAAQPPMDAVSIAQHLLDIMQMQQTHRRADQ